MRICIVAVGRVRSPEWKTLYDDYAARISRYVKCEIIELKSDADLGPQWLKSDRLVAMDVTGTRTTSTRFAHSIEEWSRCGKGQITFVIGGSDGIPPHVLQSAQVRLSLSDMTLPHRMARLLLLEQIYRAFTILRGEPYARES